MRISFKQRGSYRLADGGATPGGATAAAELDGISDATLMEILRITAGGREIFAVPVDLRPDRGRESVRRARRRVI